MYDLELSLFASFTRNLFFWSGSGSGRLRLNLGCDPTDDEEGNTTEAVPDDSSELFGVKLVKYKAPDAASAASTAAATAL